MPSLSVHLVRWWAHWTVWLLPKTGSVHIELKIAREELIASGGIWTKSGKFRKHIFCSLRSNLNRSTFQWRNNFRLRQSGWPRPPLLRHCYWNEVINSCVRRILSDVSGQLIISIFNFSRDTTHIVQIDWNWNRLLRGVILINSVCGENSYSALGTGKSKKWLN